MISIIKKSLMSHYENHNKNAINYFKDKPNKLLVVNLSKKEDFNKLMSFLNIDNTYGLNNFYWSNKS